MKKKGDIPVSYVIGAVIVVFVLVIVIFGLAKIFGFDIINFFRNLPDLNRTVTPDEGPEKLRYDLGNGKVQYYDGTQWVDFENDLGFSERIVNYDSLKKGFEDYLFSVAFLEFEFGIVQYKITESNLKDFIIRAESINPIKFVYGGGFYLSEKRDSKIEAGRFSKEPISNSRYWKYFLSFDKKIIEQFRIGGGELYEHLSNLDVTYLATESQDGEGRYHLSEYIFNDVEGKEYATCGQNSELYTWSVNARGDIYCNEKLIDKIKIVLDSEGFPDKIYVDGTRFIFGDYKKTIPKEHIGLRNAAFNAIFEKPLLISVFSKEKDFVGPPAPLYVCFEFRDEKYLVVDLKKEVKSVSVCRGGN